MKNKLIFSIPLFLILSVGVAALYFGLKFPENIPIYGWIVIALLVLIPVILIYGIIFGFNISKKQYKVIEDRRESILFSEEEICLSIPIFDIDCHIKWSIINRIVYEDHTQSEYPTNTAFKFYLNETPHYSKHEKQWWMNRLFPFSSKRKEIVVKDDCKGFYELPEMIQKYLGTKLDADFEKGILVSSKTTYRNNEKQTFEYWKAKKGYKYRQIIFSRQSDKE